MRVSLLQYSSFISYPQEKMANADGAQEPPRDEPARIYPFNTRQEPSISRLQPNVPPQRLICAQRFFMNLPDDSFVSLQDLKDRSGWNKVIVLRIARISPSY